MADEKKTNNQSNSVSITGYLKDNTLEQKVQNGVNTIGGVLTVALNEKEDYRMRFYASEYSKNDFKHEKRSKTYESLLKMLPASTTSIATLAKSFPEAKFDDLKGQSTTVYMFGSFDLYDRKDEQGNLLSSVSLRGMACGVAGNNPAKPFAPKAEFVIDGQLDQIKPETTKDGDETGRFIVKILLCDDYNKVTLPINFIAEGAGAIGGLETWNRGDFGPIKGFLRSTSETIVEKDEDDAWSDGSVDTHTTTKFINERVITAVRRPYQEGNPYYVSPETIKEYSVNREDRLSKLPNGDKKGAEKPSVAAQAQAPSASAQNKFKDFVL